MKQYVTRRSFLAATAAMAAGTTLPRMGFAQAAPISLTAHTLVICVGGRAATVVVLSNVALL